MGNCGAWLTYGLSIGNPYVILCNTTGLLFGLFYTLTGECFMPYITETRRTVNCVFVKAQCAVCGFRSSDR
jgi:hypothetical protein